MTSSSTAEHYFLVSEQSQERSGTHSLDRKMAKDVAVGEMRNNNNKKKSNLIRGKKNQ